MLQRSYHKQDQCACGQLKDERSSQCRTCFEVRPVLDEKLCTGCDRTLPIAQFSVKNGKPGAASRCKECAAEYGREWRRSRLTPCEFSECDKPVICNGLCDGHDNQRRQGRDLKPLQKVCRVDVYARSDEGLKMCVECHKWKPLEDFARGSAKDGRHTLCRNCGADRQGEYRRQNPEKVKASMAAWRAKNPNWKSNYQKLYKPIRRAREAAATTIPFTAEQLEQRWEYYGSRCWLCAAPASETDHVKPLAKGGPHMLANLRPICGLCNRSKNARWPIQGFRLAVGLNYKWP